MRAVDVSNYAPNFQETVSNSNPRGATVPTLKEFAMIRDNWRKPPFVLIRVHSRFLKSEEGVVFLLLSDRGERAVSGTDQGVIRQGKNHFP